MIIPGKSLSRAPKSVLIKPGYGHERMWEYSLAKPSNEVHVACSDHFVPSMAVLLETGVLCFL